MVKAIEIIDQLFDEPEVVYCEDGPEKYIAVLMDDATPENMVYILYPVKNRDDYIDWINFRDTHSAKQRINHTLIDWSETPWASTLGV